MTPQLTFVVNCGTLDKSKLDLIPELLGKNSFGTTHSELLDDSDGTSVAAQPYTLQALLKILHAKTQWNVTLVDRTEGRRSSIDLVQRERGATFSIMVEHDRLSAEYEQFLDYARTWVTALPKVSSGQVFDSACDIAALHRQHNLARPPACFTTHLRWVHFLGPAYYTLFLTTEDLLGTPAYHVEQAEHEVVMMRNFANPFADADPATLRQLAAITDYLKARDHFMKNQA